jgi:Phage tail lysozyme
MGPLLAIAAQLFPELIKVLGNDQSGSAQDKVIKAIKDVTGQDDPVEAQKKINEDSSLRAKLQTDLANIALEETKEQNRANEAAQQIDLEFERLGEEDRERQRQQDFQQYLRDLQDRDDARTMEMKLADEQSPLAWVVPLFAFALILMIWYLLHNILTAQDEVVNKDVFNVVLGALVTAFTTVVAYYFGSSAGSSKKDEALRSGQLVSNPKHTARAEINDGPPPSAPARGAPAGSGPIGPSPNSKNPGPSGAQPSPIRPPVSGPLAQFREKAPVVMQKLMGEFGLTVPQTAGILGNIGHECMGFKTLQEVKPIMGGAGGWGWCQWTGPRRKEFEQWASERSLGLSSDDANYGFLVHELKGTHAGDLRSLRGASTVPDATKIFMSTFEKPNTQVAGLADRVKYASLALKEYNGG